MTQTPSPLKEIDMNRNLASVLSLTTTAAAALAFAAIASGNAYADDITIDTTPFVSTKTRAEVQAEVIGQAELLRMASSELSTQSSPAPRADSGYTSAQARAEYIASRREVEALNGEDSGSFYLATLPRRPDGVMMAGSAE